MDAEVTLRTAPGDGVRADQAARPGLRTPTLLVAGALHIGFIATLSVLLHPKHIPPPAREVSIPVVFAPAPAEVFPPMLASSMVSVPADIAPASLAPLPPVTLPSSLIGELPRPTPRKPHRNPTRVVATPEPQTSPSQAVPPPSPPATVPPAPPPAVATAASAQTTQRALEVWEARIRQAVQNATIYPASARLLHRDGRAQIRFDYDRGAVEGISIAESSHVGTLDTAALAAVTRAAIPVPPAELGPQHRTMLVWVQFRLESEE